MVLRPDRHHGNVLGKYGFSQVNKVIADRSKQGLMDILGEAECEMVEEASASVLDFSTELLKVKRLEYSGKTVSLSTEAFADWWIGLRDQFADLPVPKSKFYVKSILPPNEDEFWKGQEEAKYIPLQPREGDLAIFMQNSDTGLFLQNFSSPVS